MDSVTSLEGPVDLVDGELRLQIPLDAGGGGFVACARGISRVEGDDLVITIPSWLAAQLGIGPGATVQTDNRGGRFNIRPQSDE